MNINTCIDAKVLICSRFGAIFVKHYNKMFFEL